MKDITLPQLGESVTEGTLGKWLKKVGDSVTKYEPLVEVITDKVNAEVPSDFDGTLAEIVVQEGETVSVGTVICRVTVAGEETGGEQTTGNGLTNEQAAAEPVVDSPQVQPEGVAPSSSTKSSAVATTPAGAGSTQSNPKPRYSPAVLHLAQEHDVDLTQVRGTGAGGRITRKDVLAYLESGAQLQGEGVVSDGTGVQTVGGAASPQASAPVQTQAAGQTQTLAASTAPAQKSAAVMADEVIEPSPIRKTIAKRMVESKQTAPHAWTVVEADVSNLVSLRQSVKNEFKRKEGIDLTYLPFFIKAVAEAVKQYPMMNAAWIDNQIHMRKAVNISIAVATDDALVVPVIHNADRLSIAGLAHAVNDLAARARSGRLQMEDVQGGTFTVNNTGAFGSVLSQPIINMPQAAILSVESIVKRPVVVNDAIAIRSMVNLCLSLDHRLLDGWISGQFLKAVKERLQRFDRDTVIY